VLSAFYNASSSLAAPRLRQPAVRGNEERVVFLAWRKKDDRLDFILYKDAKEEEEKLT